MLSRVGIGSSNVKVRCAMVLEKNAILLPRLVIGNIVPYLIRNTNFKDKLVFLL